MVHHMPFHHHFYYNFFAAMPSDIHQEATQGNFGNPDAHTHGGVPDVFESMASDMRDAFEDMNSFPGHDTSSTGEGNIPRGPAERPDMPNPFADAETPFDFLFDGMEHGMPRGPPPPPGFGNPHSGFDRHTGRPCPDMFNEFGPGHHRRRNHSHNSFQGRGGFRGGHGRFNPYHHGFGGPPRFPPPPHPHGPPPHRGPTDECPFNRRGSGGPPHFPPPPPHPHGPPPHHGPRGSFSFGGGFGQAFPPPSPPPPFFAHPMTDTGRFREDFTRMYENLAEIRMRMYAAADERRHAGSDTEPDADRFTGRGFHSHRGRGGGPGRGRGGFRHAGRGRSASAGPHPRHHPHHHEFYSRMSKGLAIVNAWEAYTSQWLDILSEDTPTLKLSDIPWPILIDTADMEKVSSLAGRITTSAVGGFILSPMHSLQVPPKKRIHQALKLYHPDRFETAVVAKVEDEHKQEVREAGEAVAKCLNTLLGTDSEDEF